MKVIATFNPNGASCPPGLVPGEQYTVQWERGYDNVSKVKLMGVKGMFDSSLFSFSYPNGVPLDAQEIDVGFEHLREAISVMLAANVIRFRLTETSNGLATIFVSSAVFNRPIFLMKVSDIDWLIAPTQTVATRLAAAVVVGELSFREFEEEDVPYERNRDQRG